MATNTTVDGYLMNVMATAVDRYLEMWNEPDAARRARTIQLAWTDDARYVDPMLEAAGHEGLADMVAAVHERFPGHRFTRVSAIDAHHTALRFAWELVAPDGQPVAAGIDVGELAQDGRLQSVTGFFNDPPQPR
jgi:hypothetical protein